MTSSLVGSEMCIRDRVLIDASAVLALCSSRAPCKCWFRSRSSWTMSSKACLLYTSDAADDM
eukprot:7538296-Prorocentrum_lima.AAC.1